MTFSLLSFTINKVFQQKLYKKLRELCDYFFIRHFLRLRHVLSAILGFCTISYYYKKESLNSDSPYQKYANILMGFAAIVTQLRAKWQVYLFAREIFTWCDSTSRKLVFNSDLNLFDSKIQKNTLDRSIFSWDSGF